jgi:hypothetical protein
MMNDQSTGTTNKMIEWAHEYMEAWAELVDGRLDVHHTLDGAYEIWPTQGHRNPDEVAREDFDRYKR